MVYVAQKIVYHQYHVHGIWYMMHQDHVSQISGPLLTFSCEVEEGEVLLPPSGGWDHMYVVFHWYLEFAGKTGVAS